MNLECFDNLELVPGRYYGGLTGPKRGVYYKGSIWLLKIQQSLRGRGFKNVDISYGNDVFSEYIGCYIFKLAGLCVQSTVLGMYKGKYAVLCKDVAYPNAIIELRMLRNMILNEELSQSLSGMSTKLTDILDIVKYSEVECKVEMLQRFWDMFLIDAVIGNTDRNNGNWGVIYFNNIYSLAPVYDCGGCLNNKKSDEDMRCCLENDLINNYAINYTFNFLNENNRRINPYKYIESNYQSNEYIRNAYRLLDTLMDSCWVDMIYDMLPIISKIRANYYTSIIQRRIEELYSIKMKFT